MRFSRMAALSMLSTAAFGYQIAAVPALALDNNDYTYGHHTYHRPITVHDYMNDHPKIKSATIGAGVGTAAGAVTGLVTGRGVLRGAAIGAGTGAGVGLIRSSAILARHPIVRDLATGAAVGGGVGWAGGSHGGTVGKSAAVGGAIGLGLGMFKHL